MRNGSLALGLVGLSMFAAMAQPSSASAQDKVKQSVSMDIGAGLFQMVRTISSCETETYKFAAFDFDMLAKTPIETATKTKIQQHIFGVDIYRNNSCTGESHWYQAGNPKVMIKVVVPQETSKLVQEISVCGDLQSLQSIMQQSFDGVPVYTTLGGFDEGVFIEDHEVETGSVTPLKNPDQCVSSLDFKVGTGGVVRIEGELPYGERYDYSPDATLLGTITFDLKLTPTAPAVVEKNVVKRELDRRWIDGVLISETPAAPNTKLYSKVTTWNAFQLTGKLKVNGVNVMPQSTLVQGPDTSVSIAETDKRDILISAP